MHPSSSATTSQTGRHLETEDIQPDQISLTDASLEMTGKDVGALDQLDGLLTPGTRVNVTFLATEDQATRVPPPPPPPGRWSPTG